MILLPIQTSSFLLALQQNTSLFSSQTSTMKWILVSHRSLHLVIFTTSSTAFASTSSFALGNFSCRLNQLEWHLLLHLTIQILSLFLCIPHHLWLTASLSLIPSCSTKSKCV